MTTEEEHFERFMAADNLNRLRLGDAAEELLQIQYMIEALPGSTQQTDISSRVHALLTRMNENVSDELANLLSKRNDHVAWLRFNGKTFVTCDSDAEGAFRVYMQPSGG